MDEALKQLLRKAETENLSAAEADELGRLLAEPQNRAALDTELGPARARLGELLAFHAARQPPAEVVVPPPARVDAFVRRLEARRAKRDFRLRRVVPFVVLAAAACLALLIRPSLSRQPAANTIEFAVVASQDTVRGTDASTSLELGAHWHIVPVNDTASLQAWAHQSLPPTVRARFWTDDRSIHGIIRTHDGATKDVEHPIDPARSIEAQLKQLADD